LGLDFVLVPLYSFNGEIVILLLFLKPQHNTSNIIREVRYDILFSKKMLFPPLILHTPSISAAGAGDGLTLPDLDDGSLFISFGIYSSAAGGVTVQIEIVGLHSWAPSLTTG
jgi:hypothetical protein